MSGAPKPPIKPTAKSGYAKTSQRRDTRAERIQQRQEERRRAEAQAQRAQRNKRMRWIAGGVVAAGLIVYLIVHAIVTAPPGPIPGVLTYSNLSHNHVNGKVNYAQNPPVGGDHAQIWLNCGVYSSPVPNENAVHSMEHGAVWITYQPNLASADVNHLTSLVSGHSYVILSPYLGLPSPVVASAWGVQLRVTSVTDARLKQFIQKYEQGPQTREVGGACSGGVGNPIG